MQVGRVIEIGRFAVKSMLSRLGPLHDADVRGRNLVPAFVEAGTELLRFFDLDASRLEAIINEGADSGRRVDHDDIALIAMSGTQQPYAALKLSQLNADGGVDRTVGGTQTMRDYLYEKYVYRAANGEPRPAERTTERPAERPPLTVVGAAT